MQRCACGSVVFFETAIEVLNNGRGAGPSGPFVRFFVVRIRFWVPRRIEVRGVSARITCDDDGWMLELVIVCRKRNLLLFPASEADIEVLKGISAILSGGG